MRKSAKGKLRNEENKPDEGRKLIDVDVSGRVGSGDGGGVGPGSWGRSTD